MSTDHEEEEEGRIALAEGAPEVDLSHCIIENNGVQVGVHPGMGRVIIATKDLGNDLLYQPVLCEMPALICKQQDYMDFMEKFLESPVEIQVGILDMFYQPLDSSMGKSLVEPAMALYCLGVLEDFSIIHQLLSILMTNGHQYGPDQAAIPLLGSKFGHSCNPNTGYSSRDVSGNGPLEYKLLRPVQRGEMLCFSYIADLLETPTDERRELLMDTKSFWCGCERCRGPDFLRCLPCPTCAKPTPCQYSDDTPEPYWNCSKCGIAEPALLIGTERQYTKILDDINRSLEKRRDFDTKLEYTPFVIQELVEECETQLSTTHYLTIKALRLLFTTATAEAYVHIKKMLVRGLPLGNSRVYSLFRSSVMACYQLVLAGECVAAECTGCYDPEELVPKHPANFDRALAMFNCCENVLQLPISWWPNQVERMTTRYMPILKAKFGDTVANIESGILGVLKDIKCLECGTFWDATKRTPMAL